MGLHARPPSVAVSGSPGQFLSRHTPECCDSVTLWQSVILSPLRVPPVGGNTPAPTRRCATATPPVAPARSENRGYWCASIWTRKPSVLQWVHGPRIVVIVTVPVAHRPLLGALRLGVLSEWYLADASGLRSGTLTFDALRPIRLRELEERFQPFFDQVVGLHFEETFVGSQAYLDHVLRRMGVAVVAPCPLL